MPIIVSTIPEGTGGTIQEELKAAMLDDYFVSELVGNRVYPMVDVEKVVSPFIVYGRPTTTLDEASVSLDGPGLYRTVITLSSFSTRYQEAHAVAGAIKTALENKKGRLTLTQDVELVALRDLHDEPFDELTGTYRVDLDLEIVHR